MFQLHTAYSLELLVLAAGLGLIYFGTKQASTLLRIGGYILTIVTVLNMLCTLYYGIRYWEDGYFRGSGSSSCPMHEKNGMSEGAMPGMMMPGMMHGNQMGPGKNMMPGPKMDEKSAPMMNDERRP